MKQSIISIFLLFQFQLKVAVDQLRSLSSSPMRKVSSLDKSVQTDFPAAMLEEYVIKNRRRILTLLGVQRVASTASSNGGQVGQVFWNN
jgi:hypothetical protein